MKSHTSFAASPGFLATGGILLVALAVGAMLWATGSFSHFHLLSPAKPNCVVKGEIFITTRGGDVKKAAGLKVSFMPVTEELRKSVRALLAEADQIRADYDANYEATLKRHFLTNVNNRGVDGQSENITRAESDFGEYQKKWRPRMETFIDKALTCLFKNRETTVTAADGGFSIELRLEIIS